MAVPLFSLDIRDDIMSGVLLQTRADRTVIIGCGAVLPGERPIGEGIAEVVKQAGFSGGPCRVGLGANHFFFRNLSLPFADSHKITKILPFELEETAPFGIERLAVDAIVTPSGDGRADVIAAMIEREILAERLSLLLGSGLDPEIITVSGVPTAVRLLELPGCPADFIFLDIGLRQVTMVVTLAGRVVLVRALDFDGRQAEIGLEHNPAAIIVKRPEHLADIYATLASAVQQTMRAAGMREKAMPVYLSGPSCQLRGLPAALKDALGVEIRTCDLLRQQPVLKAAPGIEARWAPGIMDQALAIGMQPGKSRKGFNFRKGEFTRKASRLRYRYLRSRFGMSIAVLVTLAFCFLTWDFMSSKMEEKRLSTRIRSVFSETLPGVTRIVEPVAQLQAEIKRLTTGGGQGGNAYKVLDLLAEISERIPVSSRVRLTLMTVDDKGVRLKGTTNTFNAVESIKKGLEKSSYFQLVTITTAILAPKGDEVLFEIKIQLGGS
jgi:type II secretory pathway component PulL